MRINGSTEVARPVGEVFDFVADERNEPLYNPWMARVDKLSPGPVGAGTRWVAVIHYLGRDTPMETTVVSYRRPRRLETRTRMSGAEIVGTVTFEERSTGTHLAWDWDVRLAGPQRLLAPLVAQAGNRREAANWAALKQHLEQAGGSHDQR
ncbi:SRPBCC family protein [Actinoplanes sp. NBRC 101535]|uniref:SRPBCC family protein n=1 Tax=Actinoplanes sp. NBRC 101535 TaxID=3032196 RepID=UPI0024A22C9B|nr:SRPBCC family protein [Actinoplanes sp. NBRC 101535]GLY08734.1 hypothetical protein Acsp01_91130 [Actinoplanes sp. NBRC 101535]